MKQTLTLLTILLSVPLAVLNAGDFAAQREQILALAELTAPPDDATSLLASGEVLIP